MNYAEKSLLQTLKQKGFTETDIMHLSTLLSKCVNPGTFIKKVSKVRFDTHIAPPKPGVSIEERATDFAMTLADYQEKYGRPMLQRFFTYWKEPNKGKTKMKWEMQETWDLAGRLRTFEENQERFGHNKKEVSQSVNVSEIINQQTNSIINQL